MAVYYILKELITYSMHNQDTDNEKITATLTAAGWSPLPETRPGYPEASPSMHYHNGTFDVGISRWKSLTPGQFLLEATEGHLPRAQESKTGISKPVGQMYIEYQNSLDDILKAIIAFARRVNHDTVGETIKPVLDAAPRAYADASTAGRQGEQGEAFHVTIDPATWYPKTR